MGQWGGWSPLLPSSCNAKGGIPSSRRYLPTYLPTLVWFLKICAIHPPKDLLVEAGGGVCLKAWKIQPQAGKGRLPEGRVVLL